MVLEEDHDGSEEGGDGWQQQDKDVAEGDGPAQADLLVEGVEDTCGLLVEVVLAGEGVDVEAVLVGVQEVELSDASQTTGEEDEGGQQLWCQAEEGQQQCGHYPPQKEGTELSKFLPEEVAAGCHSSEEGESEGEGDEHNKTG